ncbi:MAG: hypothetical protein ACM31L_06410 [Actinomycetota bacterium]
MSLLPIAYMAGFGVTLTGIWQDRPVPSLAGVAIMTAVAVATVLHGDLAAFAVELALGAVAEVAALGRRLAWEPAAETGTLITVQQMRIHPAE